MTDLKQCDESSTREQNMQLAINITLSRLRMFAAVMSRITWATEAETPLRLDTVSLAHAIEETLVWLDGERARYAGEPALAERIGALFNDASVTIEADALPSKTLH